VLLRQVPGPLELLGIGLVVVAVTLRTPEVDPIG